MREDFSPAFNDKWGAEIGEYGFTMVPNLLLENYKKLNFRPLEFVIWLQIERYRWSAEKLPFPSIETIADYSNVSDRTVSRKISTMHKKGLLKPLLRDGMSSQYSIELLIEKLQSIHKDCSGVTLERGVTTGEATGASKGRQDCHPNKKHSNKTKSKKDDNRYGFPSESIV